MTQQPSTQIYNEIMERLLDNPASAIVLDLLRQYFQHEAARTWAKALEMPDLIYQSREEALGQQRASNKIAEILREHHGRNTRKR
jgi:CHASE2 domain-containing sensor protein